MPIRRIVPAFAQLAGGLLTGARSRNSVLPVVRPNQNVERAGVLHDGVLAISPSITH